MLHVRTPDRQHFMRPKRHFGEKYAVRSLESRFRTNGYWGRNEDTRPGIQQPQVRRIARKTVELGLSGLVRQRYHYSLLIFAYSTVSPKKLDPTLRAEAWPLR